MGEKAQRLNICPCIVENAGSASTIIQSDRNGDDLVPYRTVVDVFINKTDVGEHSFHLHSHTFEILSTSPTISKRNLYTLIHIMVCTSFIVVSNDRCQLNLPWLFLSLLSSSWPMIIQLLPVRRQLCETISSSLTNR